MIPVTSPDPAQPMVFRENPGRPLVPLREVEKLYIEHVLSEVRGNHRRMSKILGISRWSLARRLRKHGLQACRIRAAVGTTFELTVETNPGSAPVRAHPGASRSSIAPASGASILDLTVLVDAIRYLTGRARLSLDHKERTAHARAWVAARDTDWQFAFEPVCKRLGIDPKALRTRLLHRAADLGAPRVSPAPRPGPGRSPAADLVTMIENEVPLRVLAQQLGISLPAALTFTDPAGKPGKRARGKDPTR